MVYVATHEPPACDPQATLKPGECERGAPWFLAGLLRPPPSEILPSWCPYNSVLLLEQARLRLAAAMLLVENLPQPVGLIVSGDAGARASRLQWARSHRVERRGMIAAWSRWPERVFQL